MVPFVNIEDTEIETAIQLDTFNLNSIGDNLPILQLYEKYEYKKNVTESHFPFWWKKKKWILANLTKIY